VRTARAFTLIEVVVALVVVLVLAAVALPNVNGYLQQKRVEATRDQITVIAQALTAFETDINANAGRLSEFSSPIISGNATYATGTDDSCGAAFSNAERDDWDGPYINFLVDRTGGMVTPIGVAQDSLTRIPNSATAGVLRINFVNSVALEDAVLLDQIINAPGDGNAAGSVTWVMPAVNGMVTLYVSLPVNNRC
jgi:prepilin-type N-terminal cleavage/methylation domain-containing protein